MGVMVDDLVTRGTVEPYRMFTSRAEYRLMLREDNADLRLMEIGHDLGLIDGTTAGDAVERKRQIDQEIQRLENTVIKPSAKINAFLESRGTPRIRTGIPMDQLLKRKELDYADVDVLATAPNSVSQRVARQVEIEIKYKGYIEKQFREIEKFKHMETQPIPEGFDFDQVHGLSNELKEKLTDIRPVSLGQASRVDGITPAALSVLMIALKAWPSP